MTASKKLSLAIVGVIAAVGLIQAVSEVVRPRERPMPAEAANGPASFGFAGSASCSARGCHGRDQPVSDADAVSLQNEYTHGLMYDKHAQAYAVLLEPRAQTIARNLAARTGEPEVKAHEDARCLACHATPQSAWSQSKGNKATQVMANWQLGGVSCEACHGPSKQPGGNTWLELHTSRKEWRDKFKPADKEAYGFWNLADYTTQAQVCAGCHVGAPADEKSNLPVRDCNHDIMAAGHPRLNFELTVYRANMPPHWKTKEEDTAKVWLDGRIGAAKASLELLKSRAEASQKSDHARWPEFAEYRCYACHRDLNTDWRNVEPRSGRSIGSFPYDSWYGALLPGLNKQVGDGYGKLTSLMAKPLPNAKEVMDAADDLLKKLDALKDVKESELLGKVKEETKKFPRAWEDAMQLTLALAALNRKELAASPDAVKPLREMAKALSFPPRGEGPKGFDFPKALEDAQKAYERFRDMK